MSDLIRDALHPETETLPAGELAVVVTLSLPSADDESLERLRSLELHVERVVGNKVFGRIEAKRLEKLRADPLVVAADDVLATPS